ncbi:MAG: hypothetical protein JST54_33485 [Deltaproteobacteria bacterium]|nr:hypothetical protein [Deltaproteobacteria bacterium]
MRRAAFLTLEDRGDFVVDDAIAIAELADRGWQIDEVPWRANVDWKQYERVMVRSTWDYQHDSDAFLAALAKIDVPLANPLDVIRWNIRKTYLRDLRDRGVRIVPTIFGEGPNLDALRGRGKQVIKPIVSANATHTYVIDADSKLEEIASHFAQRAWMAQPFIKSVTEIGEYSVFYFGGKRSHAILKVPKSGDFRVQEEHGGEIRAAQPPANVIAAADSVMKAMDRTLVQARVDLVLLDDGAPALMELELIEPSLYFRTDANAARNFTDAFEAWAAGID